MARVADLLSRYNVLASRMRLGSALPEIDRLEVASDLDELAQEMAELEDTLTLARSINLPEATAKMAIAMDCCRVAGTPSKRIWALAESALLDLRCLALGKAPAAAMGDCSAGGAVPN